LRWMAFLHTEPRWLRGVTWPLVGMVLLIGFLQNFSQIIRAITPDHAADGWSMEFALFDLASMEIVALSIMLIGSALTNLERPRVPTALALALAVLLGTFVPINVIAHFFCDTPEEVLFANSMARRLVLPWGIAAAAWYFLRRANARSAELRAAEVLRRQLESGMLEARLQALQAQVEPHFLFNTLAHVRHLYRTEPSRAKEMLESFRAYLRSALPHMRGNGSTLGRELSLVRAYLDVQQVRMGRRLAVDVDVPEALRDLPFPPMMLISLVENAIKHGLNPLPEGGAIGLAASDRDGMLIVSVTDDGRGIGDNLGSGVGLANIRGRLFALYGDGASLALTAHAPRGVRAALRVPATGQWAAPAPPPRATLEAVG